MDGWGRDKFMPVSMLVDPHLGFLVNDTVVFKVEITVYVRYKDGLIEH